MEDPKENLVVEYTDVDGFHLATLTRDQGDMEESGSITQNDLLLLSGQKVISSRSNLACLSCIYPIAKH